MRHLPYQDLKILKRGALSPGRHVTLILQLVLPYHLPTTHYPSSPNQKVEWSKLYSLQGRP